MKILYTAQVCWVAIWQESAARRKGCHAPRTGKWAAEIKQNGLRIKDKFSPAY